MYYKDDRKYTDEAHRDFAVPLIYDPLGWNTYPATTEEDIRYEIDYRGTDDTGRDILIQERLRRGSSAQRFSDFTLRYQRPSGLSEYYKMQDTIRNFSEPYYMVYGVIAEEVLARFVIVDLRQFFSAIDNNIIVVGQRKSYISVISGAQLFSGLGYNKDGSSSFVSFDIRQLSQILPSSILISEGW